MRILIVEDEVRLAMALQEILTEAQYEVATAYDGITALDMALRDGYDLILLDVMIPGKDGLVVASELRRLHVKSSILMLTAKDSTNDKVMGLDCGADDYMTKPFATEELLARIRALIRRTQPVAAQAFTFGDLVYQPGTATLSAGDRKTRLNYKEAEIMKLLMASSSTIVSKDELINKVWGYNAQTSENNVEAYISFLRKKLLFLDSSVSIVSIKKQGYKLESSGC